jgi:hypothetical protein
MCGLAPQRVVLIREVGPRMAFTFNGVAQIAVYFLILL